ncbi:MAG: alpha/beta hydrolase [Longimicrobiales bacterium]
MRMLSKISFTLMLVSSAMPAAGTEVPLWAAGAPGSEALAAKKEVVENTGRDGAVERRVSSVHAPSLTVYLPPQDKATGTAVIIAPGGGHRFLSFDHEGTQVGKWLASIGVAGFVLKYRLAREEDSPYQIDTHVLQDGLRSIRMVRSRAREWGVNPGRVGILGFSAGGEVAALAGTRYDKGNDSSPDPVERQNSKPDFMVLVYPGVRIEKLNITPETPPTFLICAYNDRGPSQNNLNIFQALQKAGVPAELHIYAQGGHGFGIRNRPMPVSSWPQRVQDWMLDRGFLPKP